MPKMTKTEKAFLKQAAGPGEKAYHVKLELKFLADPKLQFLDVRDRILELVRGDLSKVTVPTKRIDTYCEVSRVEL